MSNKYWTDKIDTTPEIKGDIIKADDFNKAFDKVAEDVAKTNEAATTLADNVKEIKSDIAQFQSKVFESGNAVIPVENLNNVVKLTQVISSANSYGIRFDANAVYDTYYWYPSAETQYYLDTADTAYVHVIEVEMAGEYHHDAVNNRDVIDGVGAKRYRKSDNNLPTESEQHTVTVGMALAFSVTKGKSINIITAGGYSDTLSNSVRLNDAQIEQVDGAKRKNIIQYIPNTTNVSDGEVNVYIPTDNGYVLYKLIHNVLTEKNTNLWRIDKAYACDDNLSQITEITTTGEWECAFGLYGRPTGSAHFGRGYIGGYAHGNEMMDRVVFVIDGVEKDIATITEKMEWNTLEIFQSTTMFDSADNITPVCKHGSNHVFCDTGVVIKQSLRWLIETRMRVAYMAMFPVSKAVSDMLMVDTTWEKESTRPVSGTAIIHPKAKYARLSKDSAGFDGRFYVTEYPSGLDATGDYFLCNDNTTDYTGPYNKCYYAITGNDGGHTVKVGDIWKSETHYELTVVR